MAIPTLPIGKENKGNKRTNPGLFSKRGLVWNFGRARIPALFRTLRLLHAITEAGFTLQVDQKDEVRFRRLVEIFDMPIAIGSGAPVLESILIDHAGPITGVCGIVKPLVMPRSTITYCRSRWPDKRPIAVSFAGLLTPWRKTAILEWLANHEQKAPPLLLSSRLNRLKTKILRRLNMTFDQRINVGPMTLSLSDTGRRFPRKSWNVDYYALLLSSRFAFVPMEMLDLTVRPDVPFFRSKSSASGRIP